MNAFPNALVGLCLLALSAYSGSSFSAHQSAVRGTAGMVSSTSALGNEAAIEVMKSGGNAIDAAVTLGFALAVTYPEAGNIGGGGFMQIYIEKDKTILSLDFRSTAPALATREFYQELKSQDDDVTRKGYKAIAVPGTIAGIFEAHEKHGTLTIKELISPVIELAKKGVIVTEKQKKRLLMKNILYLLYTHILFQNILEKKLFYIGQKFIKLNLYH